MYRVLIWDLLIGVGGVGFPSYWVRLIFVEIYVQFLAIFYHMKSMLKQN